ncbi:MAG TPA: hypothetical protein PLQ74_13170 [Pseudomonadota bacterium]|nr:hypothetical protein [Pseudomonadota bacterium]
MPVALVALVCACVAAVPVSASAATSTTVSIVSVSPANDAMRNDQILVEAKLTPKYAELTATGTITIGDGTTQCMATLPETRCL